MSAVCPNGHQSTWPDWCSTCGERIEGGAPATGQPPESGASAMSSAPAATATPAAGGPTCDNCGVPRFEHDVFCESCGYDFASGSLPEDAAAPDGSAAEAGDDAAPMHAKISVDSDFFAASIGDVELELPDPLPEQQVVPMPGARILIGRKSTSRGIFPEIDVRALTDDPAVSSRHAMLERDAGNNWTLTDLGSTNGTFLSADADEPITAGEAIPVTAGTAVYLGAWTRIDIAETSS